MQACLARLYLDEHFRRLLASDPEFALNEYELCAEEDAAIRELDATKLEFFAVSLKNKRKKRIARAFPLLFRAAKEAAEHLYDRYHALYMPKSRRSVHQDILDYGEFVEDSLVVAPELPPWIGDIARYERLLYETSIPLQAQDASNTGATSLSALSRPRLSERAVIAEFEHDVASMEDSLNDRGEIGFEPSPCAIVFCAKTHTSEARILRVNAPTLAILRLCDGRKSLSSIARELEVDLDATGLQQGVFEAVMRLTNANVLVVEPGVYAMEPSPSPTVATLDECSTSTRGWE